MSRGFGQPAARSPHPVTIALVWDRVTVPMTLKTVLEPYFSLDESRFTATDRGFQRSTRRQPLYREETGVLRFPTPLVFVLGQVLEHLGYSVVYQGKLARPPALTPARDCQALTVEASRLVAHLKSFPGAVVRLSRQWRVRDCLRFLLAQFPEARMVLGFRTRSLVQKHDRWLRKLSPRVQTVDQWAAGRHPHTVLVTTIKRLSDCGRHDFDLVVATDAEAAAAPSMLLPACLWQGLPGLALLEHDTQLHRSERMRLHAQYGPLLDLSRIRQEYASPSLCLLHAPEDLTVSTSDPDWRRQTLWMATKRNQFVARIARALAERKQDEVDVLGLPANCLDEANSEPITLLVEAPEQAKALKPLLPGWSVHLRGNQPPTGVSFDLVTLGALLDHALASPAVINATATPVVELIENRKPPRLVIDLLDAGEPLRAFSDAKRGAYEAAGWIRDGPWRS